MNVLIHIGYHKTGSTYMQEHMFPTSQHIICPRRPEVKDNLLRHSSLDFSPVALREWGESLCSQEPDKNWLVLSDEEISGHIHSAGGGGYVAKELADRLHRAFPEAHILIMIRNQSDLIESSYKQYVKEGGTFSLQAYLNAESLMASYHRYPQFAYRHLEYDSLIEYYQSLFTRDRVHVYAYETMRGQSKEFFEKLCRDVGIPISDSDHDRTNSTSNPSLSRLTVCLARLTNRFYGRDPINRRCIIHIPGWQQAWRRFYHWIDRFKFVKKWDARSPFISGEKQTDIENRYSQSNRRTAELTGIDLKSLGYPIQNQ